MTHTLKTNDAGELHTITSAGITCYDIFTRAGKYRGGKIYSQDKKFRILSGKAELIFSPDKGLGVYSPDKDLEADTRITVTPESQEDSIPAGTPHIFYFPEDTRMLEWFPEYTKSEEYERYRVMKR